MIDANMTHRVRLVVLTLVLACSLTACRLKEEASSGGPIPAPSDVAAPPADAMRTPSGLASKILRVGLGDVKPTLRSTVVVHYTGWTTDGQMFDSSVANGKAIEMGVSQFIPGWIEGLQLMRIGEKRRLWIPANLAYAGSPTMPQGMLVFDIELLNVR